MSKRSFEADGPILADAGIAVRIPDVLQSELLLIEAR
jgi:hypothetical protein